jgi:hypothetical protein
MSNAAIAGKLGRTTCSINAASGILGLEKSRQYLSSIPIKTGMVEAGKAYRYPKGHVPANKGLRRPGFAPGRMRQTQFKKGHCRNIKFAIGTLRLNGDGYVDMKIRDAAGAHAWHLFHIVIWEDANGTVPAGHCIRFKDGDRLNLDLGNFELISRKENMLRNSLHRLPAPLKASIQLVGALKRTLRRRRRDEEQDRRSA